MAHLTELSVRFWGLSSDQPDMVWLPRNLDLCSFEGRLIGNRGLALNGDIGVMKSD